MFDIIVNTLSGKGKGQIALNRVENIFILKGIPYKVHKTEWAGHATELATELNKQEHTDLIVMGGDGTFNEVLNGLTDFSKVNVGLIACGTGNDFIRAAKIPAYVDDIVEIILKNNPQPIDFIQIKDKRALNVAGAGMDVDVLVKYQAMKFLRGKIKYYASLINTLINLKFHKVKLTLDGKTEEKSVFMIAVANGSHMGGGMAISPHSVVDDGLLNIIVVNEIKKSKVLGLLLKFLQGGKHINEPCVEEHLAREAYIEILDEGKTELDGEVSENKVLDCKVVSGKLMLFR